MVFVVEWSGAEHTDRATTLLHCSAFAAFIAGILDLAQVLLRFGTNANPDNHWPTITGVITGSEIFLALSFGLRFGFFWVFVALPPTGEESMQGQMHNGAWGKWGLIGMLLKWSLAAVCIVITLLQLLYRTVDSLEKFGPIYEIECALEIVASCSFILKLILNGYLVVITGPPGPWRWKPCLHYIPVFVSLIINAAIGAGNMMTCKS